MIVLSSIMAYVAGLQDRRDDKGATAVEYGLLVALIAAVIVAVVLLLGDQLESAFSSVTDKL